MLQIAEPIGRNDGAMSVHYSDEENHAMLRAVLRLFDHWRLSQEDAAKLLGGVSARSLARWREGQSARLTVDQSDRMSHLIAIHKSLRILFADPARYYGWIKKPNAAFDGQSALAVMLGGHMHHIAQVRYYLDAMRG